MTISDELRKLVDPNNECCCEHCLSNKCKEWAIKNHYGISVHASEFVGYIVEIQSGFSITDFQYATEPEAMFKATSYIMEQLKQKESK